MKVKGLHSFSTTRRNNKGRRAYPSASVVSNPWGSEVTNACFGAYRQDCDYSVRYKHTTTNSNEDMSTSDHPGSHRLNAPKPEGTVSEAKRMQKRDRQQQSVFWNECMQKRLDHHQPKYEVAQQERETPTAIAHSITIIPSPLSVKLHNHKMGKAKHPNKNTCQKNGHVSEQEIKSSWRPPECGVEIRPD